MIRAPAIHLPRPRVVAEVSVSDTSDTSSGQSERLRDLRARSPNARLPSPYSGNEDPQPDNWSPERQQAREAQSRQAIRREREAENWGQARDSVLQELTDSCSQSSRQEILQKQLEAQKESISSAARAASCPSCGSSSPNVVRHAEVYYITLEWCFRVSIPVYQCRECHPETLFHASAWQCGAFPGSPVNAVHLQQPNIGHQSVHWLSATLLNFFLRLRCSVPTLAVDGFVHALSQQHQTASPDHVPRDTLRKVFGRAADELSAVQLQHQQDVSRRMGIEANPLTACVVCDGTVEGGGKLHSVCADGCFKFTLIRQPSAATTHAPPFQDIFVPDGDIEQRAAQASELPAPAPQQCNDFNADRVLSRQRSKLAFTGVFATCCRHGIVLKALNMVTGEKWAYATLLMDDLLLHSIVPRFFWYDINCRYGHHLRRTVEEGNYPEAVKAAVELMCTPVPPFHINMHNAACQATYNSARSYVLPENLTAAVGSCDPLLLISARVQVHCSLASPVGSSSSLLSQVVPARMQGAGRGTGEPMEVVWAEIGRLGLTTQYASAPTRQIRLEHALQQRNARLQAGMPGLLARMMKRAVEESAEAREAQARVRDDARSFDVSEEQLEEAAAALAVLPAASLQPEASMSGAASYVWALVEQQWLAFGSTRVIPLALLQGSGVIRRQASRVTQVQQVNAKLTAARQQLGIQHDQQDWVQDSQQFRAGFVQLVLHQLQSLQFQVEVAVHLLWQLETAFSLVSNRSAETKQLRGKKDAQSNKVMDLLSSWRLWGSALQEFSVSQGMPNQLAAAVLAADTSQTMQELQSSVIARRFPWSEQNGALQSLAATLLRAQQRAARSEEEIDLLRGEFHAAVQLLQRRLDMVHGSQQELLDAIQAAPLVPLSIRQVQKLEGWRLPLHEREQRLQSLMASFRAHEGVLTHNAEMPLDPEADDQGLDDADAGSDVEEDQEPDRLDELEGQGEGSDDLAGGRGGGAAGSVGSAASQEMDLD